MKDDYILITCPDCGLRYIVIKPWPDRVICPWGHGFTVLKKEEAEPAKD